MAYRKIGFTIRPEGQYIPTMAASLLDSLGSNLYAEIKEALSGLGGGRRFIDGIPVPELFKMKSGKIDPGSDNWKSFITLVHKVLFHAGFVKEDVHKVIYTDNPLLNAEEVVGNMLGKKIPWPTREQLGGEKATVETLATLLPIALREIRYTEYMRGEYYSRLRAKLGDIGFKIISGQALTQHERTFFMTYANVNAKIAERFGMKGKEGKASPIPAIQSADPLVAEAFSLYCETTETGPGFKFYRLFSNQSLESLIWYFGPYARTLEFVLGYSAPLGPYTEHRMTPVDVLQWSPTDQMVGIHDHFAEVTTTEEIKSVATKGNASIDKATQILSEQTVWKIKAPTRVCGPRCVDAYIDFPDVLLHLADGGDISKYTYEYYSKWRDRPLTSDTGASPESMYVDLALQLESSGEAQVDRLTITEFGLADYEQSALDRKVSFNNERIVEEIYYVKAGNQLVTAKVDMTDYYSRQGLEGFRPAFAEYYMPPIGTYFRRDERAVQYISAQLGLNTEQQLRNGLAITLSHNNEVAERVTGVEGRFDIQRNVRSILNLPAA